VKGDSKNSTFLHENTVDNNLIVLYKMLNNKFDFDYKNVLCNQCRPMNKRKSIQDSETTCKQNCSSQLFFT